MALPLGNILWQFHIKLNTLSAHDPGVPLLCMYPREMKNVHPQKDLFKYRPKFIQTENRLVVARGGGWGEEMDQKVPEKKNIHGNFIQNRQKQETSTKGDSVGGRGT